MSLNPIDNHASSQGQLLSHAINKNPKLVTDVSISGVGDIHGHPL